MVNGVLGVKKSLLAGCVVGLISAVISVFLPNYYTSETRILPVDAKGAGGGLGNLAAAAAAFGVGLPSNDGGESNFVDIINSRWMRERLLATEFRFHYRAWRFGEDREYRTTLAEFFHVTNPDRGVAVMAELVKSGRDTKTKILTITAETRSPELSMAIVQRTASLLEAFVQAKGRTRGGSKAVFAEQRLKEAEGEYLQAEDVFRRFMEGNRNYLTSQDPGVRLQGARLEANVKLRQQLLSTLALNREQALMEEKNDLPILSVMDPANLPVEKSRPSRKAITLTGFFLATLGCWAWLNRKWLKLVLQEYGSTAPVPESE
ncbi:hypothetical protein [Geothrix sp. 21YS21S-2]|uniref:hypothetical protein n=1 Tax=Geothrix sp. 21YS21S-2 TaxID=3068893 RepID=UPI0027B90DEF|nr:hypothetical protein [Geothrix sp. 21YS21S-2]